MYQLYRDRPFTVLAIILANAALTLWCLHLDPIINNDGITYLNLAQNMLDGEWERAFETYSWPYYSAFIAGTSALSFIDVETSAFLLNTLFTTSLSFAFVCIVAELSDHNHRIIVISVLVILLFPGISKYRSFIIRDFAYLSCYLWSLYFIFRFCSTLNKRHLIGWLAFAGLSCLFRFEGVAFLLIAPYFLIVFTAPQIPHRRLILLALSALLVVISISLTIWYIDDKYAGLIESARDSGKNVNNALDLFIANTEEKLGSQSFTFWNYIGILLANIGSIFYELIRRMAVLYFLFAVIAYYKAWVFHSKIAKRVWSVYLVSNFFLLIAFSLYNNFLVSRYTMATALTLLILAPFTIDRMFEVIKGARTTVKCALIFVLVLLLGGSIEGLDVRTKKSHIKEAGLWIKDQLPNTSTIYSNEPLIIYYSGRGTSIHSKEAYSTRLLKNHMDNNAINRFDYIALSITPDDYQEDLARQTLWYEHGPPQKLIQGVGTRRVFIFKIRKKEDT